MYGDIVEHVREVKLVSCHIRNACIKDFVFAKFVEFHVSKHGMPPPGR